jgi:hypothetical protein
MMHAALASLMPVAHAVVDTQQQLQGYGTGTGAGGSASAKPLTATKRTVATLE